MHRRTEGWNDSVAWGAFPCTRKVFSEGPRGPLVHFMEKFVSGGRVVEIKPLSHKMQLGHRSQ